MYEKIWDHHKIAYGGDYNPEQWDEATWKEDMRLFKLAGIDTLTVNIFSWAKLQPAEDVYDFSQLDKIMALCRDHGMKVVLATSTAAHPAWMAKKYPEVTRVEINGMKRKYGARHNSCPNSPVFRKYSAALAEKLAERYRHYDNIIAWHISNEYGGSCHCDNCAAAFRKWLQNRYGTIEAVNKAWNSAFWSHTFYDWDEIEPSSFLTEQFDGRHTCFQGITLDYTRFNSDSILECYLLESNAVKKHTPRIPVTTNFMETFKGLDYHRWAKHMDLVSWDCYPDWYYTPARIAMNHELIRGLQHGRPFVLMEQSPGVTNWRPVNRVKRPGVMRLWSYEAVAHGADSVMFFQMRRSVGACEKYHGAIIEHVGSEHTRVFREAAALGGELQRLGDRLLGTRTPAQVGILFDWDNWWAVEYSSGPTDRLKYLDEVYNYYSALYGQNIPADLCSVEADFSEYKVLIAPVLYMIKPGVDEKLRQFVKNGGTLLTTFFSGYVDESDIVTLGGYPGKLRDILGIWVEETDALPEGYVNRFTWNGQSHEAHLLCDLLHSEGARVLATYEEDFYAGMPALTRNEFGAGRAYYMATRPAAAGYAALVGHLCREQGVRPVMETPEGVEATIRENSEHRYLFLLNHSGQTRTVTVDRAGTDLLSGRTVAAGETCTLEPTAVMILEY
ncbi:MAG: beta-galactosidase [Ruminococcaceae bacterium]|nr:beta-galactosidase [Oscillospiraceae bacterium]